ncbi:hypothetical protein [Solibacillus ferritrahens]|uniref:hypothetical protein n=1 Tax=Solibacillus ferritrahens TaxID=3098620 RepID=UPI00300BCEE5
MFETVNEFSEYNKIFNEKKAFLKAKIEKFKSLKPGSFEYSCYMDLILVDVRAMLLENDRYAKNYTIQNHFRRFTEKGKQSLLNKVADNIDEYLKIELIEGLSIKESIKFYVDKFLVHFDDVNSHDFDKKEEIIQSLINNEVYNLQAIVENVLEYADSAQSIIIEQTLYNLTKK